MRYAYTACDQDDCCAATGGVRSADVTGGSRRAHLTTEAPAEAQPTKPLPAFVSDDLIAPIDDYMTDAHKADILPNTLDAVRLKDGEAFAWPLWVVPMGTYLITDVLKEAGVDLPPRIGPMTSSSKPPRCLPS